MCNNTIHRALRQYNICSDFQPFIPIYQRTSVAPGNFLSSTTTFKVDYPVHFFLYRLRVCLTTFPAGC